MNEHILTIPTRGGEIHVVVRQIVAWSVFSFTRPPSPEVIARLHIIPVTGSRIESAEMSEDEAETLSRTIGRAVGWSDEIPT